MVKVELNEHDKSMMNIYSIDDQGYTLWGVIHVDMLMYLSGFEEPGSVNVSTLELIDHEIKVEPVV